MRFSPGILAKLFAAILFTNVITAVGVGWGVRAAFDSGFESYIRDREDQRLTRLAGMLAEAFREQGGWQFLKGNDSLWVQLNHAVRPAPGPMPGARGDFAKGPPPPRDRLEKGPPRGFGGERPPRALVLDDSGAIVVGDAELAQATNRKPITLDGRRVGWLAAPVHSSAFNFADRRFREEQSQWGWIVAVLAVVLSAIVAAFLARGMLKPVQRIAGATRRLADGDYGTRVTSTSSDELGQLVDDFNRLGNALEKQEAARRHFMADVSHELRTPIAVLRGEIEALLDGVRQPTPEALRSLQAEVARLGKLVDDIHDLSLADVGGLSYRFETVDLGRIVAETLDHAMARVQAKRLDVAVDIRTAEGTLPVRGDAGRLAQLASNLLENTLRYTHEGGRLRVALRREGPQAVLDWSDSEPGVPAEALPRLFDRLFRLDVSRNRASGGSGLGLAIAKGIVEAHGGSIAAHASELGGLRIEVRLPAGAGA